MRPDKAATATGILLLLAGCSGSPPDDGADFEILPSAQHADVADDGAAAPSSDLDPVAPTAEATPPASLPGSASTASPAATDTVWTGTIAQTAAVAYGGDIPYCHWSMKFSNVDVTITLDGTGKLKTSKVTGRMTETTPSCPTKPIPSNLHAYALDASGAPLAESLPIAAAPAATNHPLADLVLTRGAVVDKTMKVTLRWRRTDRGAPLDWTLAAAVTLRRASP